MKCPKCHNKGFMPSREVPRPLENLGNKISYSTMNTRRYVCMQCGYRFMTKETFYRSYQAKTAPETPNEPR